MNERQGWIIGNEQKMQKYEIHRVKEEDRRKKEAARTRKMSNEKNVIFVFLIRWDANAANEIFLTLLGNCISFFSRYPCTSLLQCTAVTLPLSDTMKNPNNDILLKAISPDRIYASWCHFCSAHSIANSCNSISAFRWARNLSVFHCCASRFWLCIINTYFPSSCELFSFISLRILSPFSM